MRRRRMSSDNPVSFFTFQDALMGFLGVMLLIVLLLVITPITMTQSQETVVLQSPVAEKVRVRDVLRRENAELQEKLVAFRSLVTLDRAGLEKKAQLLSALQEDITTLEDEATQTMQQYDADGAERLRRHRLLVAERNRINSRVEDIKRNPRMTFIVDEGAKGEKARQAYLIEVRGGRLTIGRAGDVSSAIWREGGDKELVGWAKSAILDHSLKDSQIVLVIKPSGWELGEELLALLQSIGVHDRGVEYIKEDTDVFSAP